MEPETNMSTGSISIPLNITKRDDERRMVFGYAKFSEDPENRGYYYIDKQDDVITPSDLEDSAYDYVLNARDAGEMHITKGAGTLVESFVVTPDKLEKMGLERDALPVAWWVGYHVSEVEKGEADPWDKIKDGTYTGFSVEGTAFREDVDKAWNPAHDTADTWLDEGQVRERRQLILQMFRDNRITEPEKDQLMQTLPAPEEYRALVAEQRAEHEAMGILARIRRAMGLDSDEAHELEEIEVM